MTGSFAVGGLSTESPGFQAPYQSVNVGGTISLDAYLGELFTVWTSVSFAYAHAQGADSTKNGVERLLPRVELGPGVRLDDTRLTLGYTYAPTITDGSYDGRGLGQLSVRVSTVIARRLSLSALGELILSGGRARLELAVFPSRVLGLGAAFEYAEGALHYDSRAPYRQWEPSASVSWWITWWLGLGLEYRFTHTELVRGIGTSVGTHRGTGARIPAGLTARGAYVRSAAVDARGGSRAVHGRDEGIHAPRQHPVLAQAQTRGRAGPSLLLGLSRRHWLIPGAALALSLGIEARLD